MTDMTQIQASVKCTYMCCPATITRFYSAIDWLCMSEKCSCLCRQGSYGKARTAYAPVSNVLGMPSNLHLQHNQAITFLASFACVLSSSLGQLSIPQSNDLHILGGLGSQICIRGLDGFKDSCDLTSSSVNLHRAQKLS